MSKELKPCFKCGKPALDFESEKKCRCSDEECPMSVDLLTYGDWDYRAGEEPADTRSMLHSVIKDLTEEIADLQAELQRYYKLVRINFGVSNTKDEDLINVIEKSLPELRFEFIDTKAKLNDVLAVTIFIFDREGYSIGNDEEVGELEEVQKIMKNTEKE